jgi:hypothetical protein
MHVTITNPKIISFYNEHKHLDFEQTQLDLIQFINAINIKANTTSSDNISSTSQVKPSKSSDYLQKDANTPSIHCLHIKNSKDSNTLQFNKEPQNMEFILNNLNPTSTVINNADTTICCDYIIKHNNNTTVLIENKTIEENISPIVIDVFNQTCQTLNSHGILMSQYTGIVDKEDFEIEITPHSNVIIYMHKVNYNENSIRLALNIINKIHDTLLTVKESVSHIVSEDALTQIKNEYQQFVNDKSEIQASIKHINKKVDNVKFNNLSDYLSEHFTQVDKPKLYKCTLCDIYTSNTLKGMAAHKRGCKKKFPEPII